MTGITTDEAVKNATTAPESIEDKIKALQKDKARLSTIRRRLDKIEGEKSRLKAEAHDIKSRHGMA